MSTKYFIGSGDNWTDDTQWSTSSGGANDTTQPTAADDAILDANSGNCTLSGSPVCRSLNCTGYASTLTHNSSTTFKIGDGTAGLSNIMLKLVSGMTYTLGSANTSVIQFVSSSSTLQTIDTGGKTLGPVSFPGFSSSPNVIFASDFTATELQTNGGYLDFDNKTFTIGRFYQGGANAKTLDLGESTINLTNTSGLVWTPETVTTILTNGSEIIISTPSSSSREMRLRGKTYDKITYTVDSSTGALYINTGGTVDTLEVTANVGAKTLQIAASTTLTILTSFNVNGTSGNLVSLESSTPSSQFTISKASGAISVAYVDISDSIASGGANFQAYTTNGNVDGGNNTGWVFQEPTNNEDLDKFLLLIKKRKRGH